MAKILLLATYDTKLAGHAFTQAEQYKEAGHEVCFISLYRIEKAPVISIYDKKSVKKSVYSLFNSFLLNHILSPNDNKHCFCSTYLLGISAERILRKCPFVPEIIIINWVPDFLNAKIVYDLYQRTGAKIVVSMIDEAILSLCHYHCDCEQFKSGCENCPSVRRKWIPRYVMSQRKKYWSNIPMSILGSHNDIVLAKQVVFLKNKDFYPSIRIPTIPFIISKKEARTVLDLPNNDFIIFAGAHYLYEKRKGFDLLSESLNIFADKLNRDSRNVTLLLIGYGSKEVAKEIKGINVIAKEFLKGDDFYYAYYACDIYASPTLADSGPVMVSFSIACGRPVVAFPVGYALDLVVSKETGYMAKYGDPVNFADGIDFFYQLTEAELFVYENNCRAIIHSLANKNRILSFD